MQKKNRKGFTLIELLAVIVILAIIALIAVPVIMNVITKARKSAFEDSAYGIVKAGELYYSNQLLEPEGMTESKEFTIENGTFTSAEKLDVSGSLPSSGKVTVTSEGKVALAISNGEYCIRKATTESKVKAEKLSDLGGVCNYKTVFTKASDGTEVPACITNNTECSFEEKVGVQVNSEKKYDFYMISDDTENGEITLLMSETLGDPVAWVNKEDYLKAGGLEENWYTEASGRVTGNVNKGPLTALKALEERTSSWTNIPSRTYQLKDEENSYPEITVTARARMLTNSEVRRLTCCGDHGETIKLAKFCTGGYYWTSSASSKGQWAGGDVYEVDGDVTCTSYTGPYAAYDGADIRPVITVSKSIL